MEPIIRDCQPTSISSSARQKENGVSRGVAIKPDVTSALSSTVGPLGNFRSNVQQRPGGHASQAIHRDTCALLQSAQLCLWGIDVEATLGAETEDQQVF
jgi:hypothetical protein